MIKIVDIKEGVLLKDYDLYSALAMSLRDLNQEASKFVPRIRGRKIWMVNSAFQGGGVAEMMPRLISLFRQLGVECDWVVFSSEIKEFYTLTKKIHNQIHGEGEADFTGEEMHLYREVNRQNAEEFSRLLKPDDIVVIHDPQPMGMAEFVLKTVPVTFIWRCHIGYDKQSKNTEAAWDFLKPYAEAFSLAVFSASEYIPSYFAGRSVIMHPTVDPLDHKNRELQIHKVVGIFCNSNLVTEYHPVLTPPFTEPVRRLQPDGTFRSPLLPEDIGILFRPLVVQISRWDRLKGFLPLMQGFAELKGNIGKYSNGSERNVRRLQLCHLIMAGPDPDYVEDDPEGRDVINELKGHYLSLPGNVQSYISILKLPMADRKSNELIVNALQRTATIVVQNSLKEGFGLTVTEAMWKAKPVIGSNVCGIRQQIRDGMDGLLIQDPFNMNEIAERLNFALSRPKEREVWGHYGHKSVIEKFLIFTQLRSWLQIFVSFK
jgi:trehalose synthase